MFHNRVAARADPRPTPTGVRHTGSRRERTLGLRLTALATTFLIWVAAGVTGGVVVAFICPITLRDPAPAPDRTARRRLIG